MIVAQRDACLSAYWSIGCSVCVVNGIEEDGRSSRACTHSAQIAIEIDLAILVIWRKLGTTFARAHDGRQLHFTSILARGACLLVHMLSRYPASVYENNVAVGNSRRSWE